MQKSAIFSLLGPFWGTSDPKKPPRGTTGVLPKNPFCYFFTHIMLKVCAKFQKFQGAVFEKSADGRTDGRTDGRG